MPTKVWDGLTCRRPAQNQWLAARSVFHRHFLTALTHFVQAENVITLSNPFLDPQAMGHPALNNIFSTDEWKVCKSIFQTSPLTHTFVGVKTCPRSGLQEDSALQFNVKKLLLYCC